MVFYLQLIRRVPFVASEFLFMAAVDEGLVVLRNNRRHLFPPFELPNTAFGFSVLEFSGAERFERFCEDGIDFLKGATLYKTSCVSVFSIDKWKMHRSPWSLEGRGK
jgi:hypothetical protein